MALNLDLTYFEHRKTKRLIGLLGRGAEVLPLKLWAYCGRAHPVDGKLSGYSDQEIESLVVWWGKPGQCISAMATVGFVDGTSCDYRVHDWEEHQGHIAAFHERAKKGAKVRWERIKSDAPSNATSIAKPEDKQCPYLPNQPNQTIPQKEEFGSDPASAVEDWARNHTPMHLRSPEFFLAFGSWILCQKDRPSPITQRAQLDELGKHTVQNATEMLMRSVRQGWKAVVPLKQTSEPKRTSPRGEWASKPSAPG